MEKTQITRKELYNLVWLEPMTAVAKRLNISDYNLRQLCIKMNIPTPDSGYWMKKQFGKPVEVKEFITEFEGEETINLLSVKEGEEVMLLPKSPILLKQKEIEEDTGINLQIPERLHNPHPLIAKYKENMILRKKHYRDYNVGYDNHLSINVGDEHEHRALLIMDTLIKAIKHRGHDIKIVNRQTKLIIDGEDYEVSIREKNKRVEDENSTSHWDRWRLIPTGLLVFKIEGYYGKEWIDGSSNPLQNQLSRIIAKLEFESEREKREREERRIRDEENERQKKIQRDLREKKEKEFDEFKNLIKDAHRWKQLIVLREYIEYIERNIKKHQNSGFDLDWIKWARAKADWYDPTINLSDDLLNDFDRNKIVV